MISWMQRNKKYLVPTIWVATIAFIGAGAVGWGSMDFGERSTSVAKVGDIAISKVKYSFSYNNLYSQLAQQFGGNFDQKKAKELGLEKKVFNQLIQEALLLNLAKEFGIIVTDKEVALEIASYKIFHDKGNQFNKSYYENFLNNKGLKAKDFETIIKESLKIQKLMKLLNIKPLIFENEVMASTFYIADKLKYNVVTTNDIKVDIDENELKRFWKQNKMNYLTPTKYKLQLLWTSPKDKNFTNQEIEKYYKENSFEYVDKNGTIKPLEQVKDDVIKALTLKKLKKEAIISRSRFKKGKINATETIELNENDSKFSQEIWNSIKLAKANDILKPKIVDDRYVTIKIASITKPTTMSYEEAKELAKKDLEKEKIKEALETKAKELEKNPQHLNQETKKYISLSSFTKLDKLSNKESLKFIKNIFASDKKINSIKLSDNKIVVYEIIDQKLLDANNKLLKAEIEKIKNNELYKNLISKLSKKYNIKSFVKGF